MHTGYYRPTHQIRVTLPYPRVVGIVVNTDLIIMLIIPVLGNVIYLKIENLSHNSIDSSYTFRA